MSSVEEVVDALFRVLGHLASSALDLLDVKLRIPIISDIRGAIGVPEISSLDLFCWIGAVGYTLVFKMMTKTARYFLIKATPEPSFPPTRSLIWRPFSHGGQPLK